MLTFKQVAKNTYDTIIFPPFDLTIHPHDIIALYSNVNIREQLIELLHVYTLPSDGSIWLGAEQLTKKNKDGIQIFALQEVFYENLTVKEMVHFINEMQNERADIGKLLSFVSLEQKSDIRIHRLTFSERKRLQLACLLLQDANIYVFEELDQNVDLESKQIFMKVLQQLKKDGKCICLLTMNIESALNFADRVYRLDESGLHEVEIAQEEQEEVEEKEIMPVKLEKIPSKIDDKIVLFDPFEIDYIESNEGISYLFIKGEKFPSISTLNELEGKLMPFGFFRCHRSYIVNLQKVREVITWTRNSYSLILDDQKKTTIPLSKSKMVTLKEMLGM